MSDNFGNFVWYDVMTTDCDAAEAFYRAVIGWEIRDSGMTDRSYRILSAGALMVGGLMPIPEHARAAGVRPAWMGYIAVDDVDAYAGRVADTGGSVHRPPEDIPGVGRFAVVADPHGAGFMLFRGIGEQAPQRDAAAPGHIGWHELHAGDRERAFTFYARLFGWKTVDRLDMGPMGIYQTFGTGGAHFGGMMTKTPQTPVPFWLFYFNVAAIDAAAARVAAAGGKVVNGPHMVPTGQWIVQGVDPQGAMFALLAPKR
jgi:predicted enzyme related to lactoylglutathione lyase